ncbi:uncharacterized protein ACBT44_010473 isoform 8-T8 [Syngnathus typhle]
MPPGVSTQMELDPVHKESIRICLWRSQLLSPSPSVRSQLFFAARPRRLSACSVMGSLGWYAAGIFGSRLFSSGVEVLRMC